MARRRLQQVSGQVERLIVDGSFFPFGADSDKQRLAGEVGFEPIVERRCSKGP